jgi:TPR repeat protein
MTFVLSILFAVILSVSSGFVATAQDYNKGLAAYEAGDFVTALEEWRPLAEQGHAMAQTNLGVMYSNGQGVLQDDAEAVRLFELAAEQGEAMAQYNLGLMYYEGIGVLQDYSETITLYRLAIEQGHSNAQSNLGWMYSNGRGVLQDNVKAHMWYNIGAANGSAPGGENREKIAARMTPADISLAQAMARECMSSGYSDCGW